MSLATANADMFEYLRKVSEFQKGMRLTPTFLYSSVEEFVAAHGTAFLPTALPPTIRPMKLSQCFENAFRVASRSKAFHYVEGYALGIMAVSHAWVIDEEGHAYDPTWASGATGLGSSYVGVELDLTAVKAARRIGCASVLHNWRDGYPALQGQSVLHPEPWFCVTGAQAAFRTLA